MNEAAKPANPRAFSVVLLLVVWSVVLAGFLALYWHVRSVILHEIRTYAMGIAVTAAEAIAVEDLNQIQTPDDASKEAFQRVQGYLDRAMKRNPEVRFLYTMRRSTKEGARAWDYQYIVDSSSQDLNGSGVIDPDEESMETGSEYSAERFDEMAEAWSRPMADPKPASDPPYGAILSGYAPVVDSQGETHAIVGVDIIADKITAKMSGIRVLLIGVAAAIGVLLSLLVLLVARDQRALFRLKRLNAELARENKQLASRR